MQARQVTPYRHIATRGFNAYEQELLLLQLRMVSGRTKAQWHYAGEGASGDALFMRSKKNKNYIFVSIKNKPITIKSELGWPPRLLGVIDLLDKCEELIKSASKQEPPASISSHISQLNEISVLIHDELALVVSPSEDRIYTDQATLQDLISALLTLRGSAAFIPTAKHTTPAYKYKFGFNEMLWLLSLLDTQGLESCGWGDSGVEYHINSWPIFGVWHSSQTLMRLAALYSRQFYTIDQGTEFANTSPTEVAAFLYACKICGLGLESRNVSASVIPRRNTNEKTRRLLHGLRLRLGLGV